MEKIGGGLICDLLKRPSGRPRQSPRKDGFECARNDRHRHDAVVAIGAANNTTGEPRQKHEWNAGGEDGGTTMFCGAVAYA
jgi:hypothetical protein